LAMCLSIIYSAIFVGSSERMKRFIIVVVVVVVVSARLMTTPVKLEKAFQFIVETPAHQCKP
jgi:hypothetical protein